MTALIAGVALGLASSAHCAAMCGPLVLSVGRHTAPASRRVHLRHAVLYHGARIATYVALALPAGVIGDALTVRGLGRVLAIGAAILLLAAAAGTVRLGPLGGIASGFSAMLARLSSPLLRWSRARPIAGALITGTINGLLPCGLVYAALTTAAAAGSVGGAALLMAGFGMGTTPVLVAIAAGAASLSPPLRLRLRPVGPVVLAVTAAILIVRAVTMPHQHGISPVPQAVHLHH